MEQNQNTKMEEYVELIKYHMGRKKGEENLEELDELFGSEDFMEILKKERIDIFLKEELKHTSCNKNVLNHFIGTLGVMLKENKSDRENLEFLYFYLKEKRSKKEIHTIFFAVSAIFFILVVGCMALQWSKFDTLLFYTAPSNEEISGMVQKQYGIEVQPEDIQTTSLINDDYETNKRYPKLVLYTIHGNIGNKRMTFSGEYLPSQEVKFDLEMQLAKECLEKYFDSVYKCEFDKNNFECYLKEPVSNQENKEDFLRRFKQALEEIFDDPIITQKFKDYTFFIYMDESGYSDSIYVTLNESNLTEKLEEISSQMDASLENKLDEQEILEMWEYIESNT